MTKLIPEIFEDFAKAQTREEKVAILQKYNSVPLRTILQMAFHPLCVFEVEIPTYRPDTSPLGLCETTLFLESRRLKIFQKDNQVSVKRRMIVLKQMLEALHASEARIVEGVIRKNLSFIEGLTPDIIHEAFPGLLPEDTPAHEAPKRGRGRPRKDGQPVLSHHVPGSLVSSTVAVIDEDDEE